MVLNFQILVQYVVSIHLLKEHKTEHCLATKYELVLMHACPVMLMKEHSSLKDISNNPVAFLTF